MENKPTPPKTTKEFLLFVLHGIVRKKKWFLLPVWVLLVMVGILLMVTGNSHLLPAIYIAF